MRALTRGRCVLLFTCAALLAGCGSSPSHPAHVPPSLSPGGSGIPQGLYESCAPGSDEATLQACEARVATMARAGFRLVLNYDVLDASATNIVAYAEYAARVGMKVAWAVEGPGWWKGSSSSELSNHAALAATCRCSDNAGLLAYVVGLVKARSATWGYYVADEPGIDARDAVISYSRQVHSLDRDHPTMLVSAEDCGTLGAGVQPFIDAADVVAADYYPVGTPCPISAWTSIASNVQAYARAHQKVGTVMVAQAACLCEYPEESAGCSPFPACATTPTAAQMAEQLRAITTSAVPLVVMWYSYFINGSGAAITGQHWLDLVTAATGRQPPSA